METSVLVQPEPTRYPRIAHPLHTVLVLAIVAFMAALGSMNSGRLQAADLNRARLYERTMVSEWLMLAVVIAGVWLSGSPLTTILGDRWRSARQVLLDIGIAVVFLIVSLAIGSTVGMLFNGHHVSEAAQSILPHGGIEIPLWIALSITAGICEEAIYRGYFQRQFSALTNNASVGIILSAAAFGGAHAYQGFQSAFQIGLLGVMLGILAHWRKTVRPGMVSHAVQDILPLISH